MFLVYGLLCDGELFYIGKTTEDRAGLRLTEHKTRAKYGTFRICRKINKLLCEGKTISMKVLYTFDNETDQNAKEVELITLYGRKSRNGGGILYNTTIGGEGVTGIKHTDATKKKMSDAKKGNTINVGRKRPDMVDRWGKKVYLYDMAGNRLDAEYESCHAAGDDLGISFKKISECIKFSRKCKVDRWPDHIQFSYEKSDTIPPYEENLKLKRIEQYTLDGVLVKQYDSVTHVIKENPSFGKTNVAAVARGIGKSAHGYKWKYLD